MRITVRTTFLALVGFSVFSVIATFISLLNAREDGTQEPPLSLPRQRLGWLRYLNVFRLLSHRRWRIPGYALNEADPLSEHFAPHANWTVPDRWSIEEFEELFLNSYNEYRAFLSRQSETYEEAVRNYKKRYSRDPPPGFEGWFDYAKGMRSLVIDDYDTIEESLAPYRVLPRHVLERRMYELRDHDPKGRIAEVNITNGAVRTFGGSLWQLLDLKGFVKALPDLSFLMNGWDEPFVIPQEKDTSPLVEFFEAAKVPWWPKIVEQCAWEGREMGSGRRNFGRFITSMADAKAALDVCAHPEYEGTHGFLNAPVSFTGTRQLVPIMSMQKLSVFKDLLMPSASPFHPDFLLNDGVRPFDSKKKVLFWRGSPTGGHLDVQNILKSHRVRLALLSQDHQGLIDAKLTIYFGDEDVRRKQEETFGDTSRADKGEENNYGYLMDMDGNGQSGRFYRLLRSKAVVFKSTIFQQWHDDRLFPWVHYVPVQLGMPELVEELTWLARTERGEEISRRIAEESDWWARRALRVEDAEIYMYRLLLEFASLFHKEDTAA
ncbi:Beta-1,2-xylosyltransferase [Drechslerella dactyloides]|uniref:Beta-1,2-xylosyltransferase n=1 Tax=Drechslerella dactyloides TaxID=74499 RepID=A0AAD6IVC7_DREDA|nr:Beta-1,2-xylosyltransferase [Drechslerella dactyloides]